MIAATVHVALGASVVAHVGTLHAVPMSLYFTDAAGFDVTRMTVQWTWSP